MYAKRNTLTATIIFILFTSVGYWLYYSKSQELKKVREQQEELNMRLRGSLEIAETLQHVKAEHDSLQTRWLSAPKKLLNTEEPAFSLSYINWLINVNNLQLDFDFYLNKKVNQGVYTAFSYTLNGEGSYRDITSLIWYITKNPLLYQIRSVTLKRTDKNPNLLHFIIMFEGYSMHEDWGTRNELSMPASRLSWLAEFNYNAFAEQMPIIHRPAPRKIVAKPSKPIEPPGLIDIEKATLLAITNNQAYIKARDGKLKILKVGDLVRRGRLARIDQTMNQVEFELTTQRGPRTVRLNLEYN